VDDDGGAYGDDDGEGDGVGYRGKREVGTLCPFSQSTHELMEE